MKISVLKETHPGENRVALTPAVLASLIKAGFEVFVETGAGDLAGYPDSLYDSAGGHIVNRDQALACEVVTSVRLFGANEGENPTFTTDQCVVAMMDPLAQPGPVQKAAASGARLFSLEMIPRITRAQAMDVLSSQASLAGYKAVLLGANAMNRILPMMTTAAGTIPPAKVMILGAGVAGLQAIATAKRLGAVVIGYDVRPEVKTQIESLGARFLELDLKAEEGEGGYAKEQSAEFYARQQELLGDAMAEMDLIITTAAVPGRKAPILITQPMVKKMKHGAVVVDLAAERGGNVEGTVPGETVTSSNASIMGPVNIPSTLAFHASAVFAKNVASFVLNMVKEKALNINKEDPIVADTLLTEGGAVVHARVQELLK
jgi:H+-translocating NAD(P) transhydrogenase subunit alpha